MIWEVFNTVIFNPANDWHKVSYKTGDLTLDQGRITHYDKDLALWNRRVCLSNNWKNYVKDAKLEKIIIRIVVFIIHKIKLLKNFHQDIKQQFVCPNGKGNKVPIWFEKYSRPLFSTQLTTDTKSATKLGISHLTKAELPTMT